MYQWLYCMVNVTYVFFNCFHIEYDFLCVLFLRCFLVLVVDVLVTFEIKEASVCDEQCVFFSCI